jgi:hypothetical protein
MNHYKRLYICLVIFYITQFLNSCNSLSAEKKLCPIDELLITTADLPGNQWSEVGSRSYRDAPSRLGIERIGTGFSTIHFGEASENIYHFRTNTEAREGLSELSTLWEGLVPIGTDWYTVYLPSDILVDTNNYLYKCSVSGENKVKVCWFIAQYDTTVIEFKSNMIIVSENDFNKIIESINTKANICEQTEK